MNADPFYTLTQNALADGTYLDYLRNTYGTERAWLGSLAAACKTDQQLQTINSDWPAAAQKLESLEANQDDALWDQADKAVGQLWTKRDDRVKEIQASIQVHATDQTWSKAIYIPTSEDSQKCFQRLCHQGTAAFP